MPRKKTTEKPEAVQDVATTGTQALEHGIKSEPEPEAGDTSKDKGKATPKAKGKYGTRGRGSTSFYLAREILDKLKYRADGWADNSSMNGRLEADLLILWNALDIGTAHAAQQITRGEAKAILDVMNGTWWDATQLGMMIGGGLTINIQDGIALNQLDKKWDFNGPDLIKKLGKLDRLSMLGLLDWARVFWAHHDEIDPEEYVARFQPDPEQPE